MSKTLKLFFKSKYYSRKYEKYFAIYDELFINYKNKKITFIEIGVANGGSLVMWKKYFGKNSRIIGIDLNPRCKIFKKKGFEIFIGDSSNQEFMNSVFKKIGKVDIILDDGGHTNSQQINAVVNCIPNINRGGLLVTEDTHASYMKKFGNTSKYSFINFSKKIVDDINYTFLGFPKFNFSLNKYIYSIRFFESIVAFYIDDIRCSENKIIKNKGFNFNHEDFRLKNSQGFLNKYILAFFIKKIEHFRLKKFFK